MFVFRWLYSLLFALLLPMIVLRLVWRSSKNPAYRHRIGERLGFVPAQSKPAIWVHSVSVGETIAVAPLVRELQKRHPGHVVVMTTTTPTGSVQVKRLLGDTVLHYYFPYDLASFISRFVNRLSVRVCVIVETEIWPNLLCTLHRRQIPVFLANARLSVRSEKGYAKCRAVMLHLLNRYQKIIARGESDYRAFLRLGVATSRLCVGGNIKYDLEYSAEDRLMGKDFRSRLGARLVWIAASTHEGEEAILLQAHRALVKRFPSLLLLLVPRHADRCDSVSTLIRRAGLSFCRRSQHSDVGGDQVYLVDSIGELRAFYVASDIVFMGGSLVSVGGHNFLEPALLAKPLLSGPCMVNFVEVSEQLQGVGGLMVVSNAIELENKISQLLSDSALRQQLGERAYSIIEQNKGAIARHGELISVNP